ncbi:hypothetical protein [Klebsiella quasivariicola]|uniref:hypothetical protein n=1 Tax=Klebsiella quasivariicola TaxID=2026240 RepID=UPI002479255A|nr:hypothetical protein [Klebsiella quasivariicola]
MTAFFHGTSEDSATEIKENGFSTEMVFFTPRKDVAEEYGEEVVAVYVDTDDLMIDLDMAGATGMSVDEANAYLNNEEWDINNYINAGYSLCAKVENVRVAK